MNKKIGAVALAAFATTLTAAAANSSCIARRDATALEVASVQQQLMVAALTCGDVARYNEFVEAYRPQLQASDAELMQIFIRSGRGAAGYHAFKTRAANMASLKSAHEPDTYCSSANEAFNEALGGDRNLAIFVSEQPLTFHFAHAVCEGDTSEGETPRYARRHHHQEDMPVTD